MNLLEILEAKQLITQSVSRMLKNYSDEWNLSFFEALIRTNILSENSLLEILSGELSLSHYYSIDRLDLTEGACTVIDFRDACNYICFNLGKSGGLYRIVVNNPLDCTLLEFLDKKFDDYEIVIAEKKLIIEATMKYYGLNSKIPTFDREENE